MTAKSRLALLPALFAMTSVDAQTPTPIGVWQDSRGRVQVEIAPCGESLCGKIVWFKWPNDAQGLPLVDLKNMDPALRTRPLQGLTILYGLRRTGKNTWEDGKIYNPEDGKSYDADMSIDDDGKLEVRAHAGLFGKTLTWTRMNLQEQSADDRPPGDSL